MAAAFRKQLNHRANDLGGWWAECCTAYESMTHQVANSDMYGNVQEPLTRQVAGFAGIQKMGLNARESSFEERFFQGFLLLSFHLDPPDFCFLPTLMAGVEAGARAAAEVLELHGLVSELAAEARPNHGLPQFMIVIDSCNTVASETHTKYGIWARLTQR